MTFAVGSIVRLNSGSPRLTVTAIEGNDVKVRATEPTPSAPDNPEMTFSTHMLTEEPLNAVEDQAKDSVTLTDLAEADEPRVLAGLQEGRIVDYRFKDSIVRPAIVVCAGDRTGLVALVVFFKGIADFPHLPRPLPTMASGHKPDNTVLVLDVPYAEMYTPDTWGWPAKQAVRAASVDAAGIEPVIIALLEPIIERQYNRLLEVVNEKLEAHNESVADAIAKHGQVLIDATDKLLAKGGVVDGIDEGGDGATGSGPVHNHPDGAPCARESCPAFVPTLQAAEAQANSAASTTGGPSAS